MLLVCLMSVLSREKGLIFHFRTLKLGNYFTVFLSFLDSVKAFCPCFEISSKWRSVLHLYFLGYRQFVKMICCEVPICEALGTILYFKG